MLAAALVLVAVDKRAGSYPEIKANGCYALNILGADQEEISRRFATPGPKDYSGLAWKAVATGAPVFEGTLGYVDCRLVDVLPGGDHDIFIGEIVAGDASDDGHPLLFFSGKYRRLAE